MKAISSTGTFRWDTISTGLLLGPLLHTGYVLISASNVVRGLLCIIVTHPRWLPLSNERHAAQGGATCHYFAPSWDPIALERHIRLDVYHHGIKWDEKVEGQNHVS
jgi:hypothetical protein